MKLFLLLSLFAAVGMALPGSWPWGEGCCDSWSVVFKKCYRWIEDCDRDVEGPWES